MIEIFGKKYTKLNLACGNTPHTKFLLSWLNVDIKEGTADYVCDVRNLPPEWTGSFEEVRASHVLEHLYIEEQLSTLNEWVRVLEPGGILRIAVPDLEIVVQCLLRGYDKKMRPATSGVTLTPVMAQIYGLGYETAKTEERWRHRTIFNSKSLRELLESQGKLENIIVYPQNEDPAYKLRIKDDSQNQFTICVKAIKKAEPKR